MAKPKSTTVPVLSYNAPMGGAGEWTHAGGYSIWSMTQRDASTPWDLWENSGDRLGTLPAAPYVLHNIAAKTPHRLAHVFGFWRISDCDTVFLKNTDGPNINYTLLLTTGAPQYLSDRVAWYCAGCRAKLYQASFETKRFGQDAFWDWTLREVRSFNSDAKARTCSSCGAVHRTAYGMSPANDTEDEEETRKSW